MSVGGGDGGGDGGGQNTGMGMRLSPTAHTPPGAARVNTVICPSADAAARVHPTPPVAAQQSLWLADRTGDQQWRQRIGGAKL